MKHLMHRKAFSPLSPLISGTWDEKNDKRKLQMHIHLTKKNLSSDDHFPKPSTLMSKSTVNNYMYMITNYMYIHYVQVIHMYVYQSICIYHLTIIYLPTYLSREWYFYMFFLILKTSSWGRCYYQHSPFHKSDRKR